MSIKGYAASACRDEQAQDEMRIEMFIRFWAKKETKDLKHTGKAALLPVFKSYYWWVQVTEIWKSFSQISQ